MKALKHLWLLVGAIVALTGVAVLSNSTSVQAASCVTGSKNGDFTGTRNGSTDTITIWTKDNVKLCNDVSVNFTTFKVDNPNYNGQPFKDNPTAIPQSFFANQTVVLKKGTNGKVTVKMDVPDACTAYQIDAYVGPVQTSVTTSGGLVGPKAIVGKLFDKTKTDCSVPQVKACNTNTGVIGMVDKDKADTDPYTTDLSKCKVKACNTETGVISLVDKSKANTSPYTTDLSKCQVKVCNTNTGVVDTVNKEDADKSPYTDNMDKCEKIMVCVLNTGKTDMVTKDDAKDTSKYGGVNDDACNPPTPETPTTPKETPNEIPSTGPVEIVSGIVGAGSVAGAATTYVRSRRNLFRFFK